MTVTGEEKRAFVEHGQIKGRPGTEFLVVHIPAEAARHRRAAASPGRRRRGCDDPEERIERNFQTHGITQTLRVWSTVGCMVSYSVNSSGNVPSSGRIDTKPQF